ncbi:MAG TPA: A/G-specific adenine glycosylase [Bacteroidia bacterium]|nr:A/G-specific adenine glycosylase [Bacteroidia bacterium]
MRSKTSLPDWFQTDQKASSEDDSGPDLIRVLLQKFTIERQTSIFVGYKFPVMSFGDILLHWYQRNKRELPWRSTRNPYYIWLSEIILQQTRVEQGLNYYLRFIEKYPDVKKLAEAPLDEVLKMWQGLGYYSRARNLHAAAKFIVTHHDGKFPDHYEAIRNLKGVGDYTAAAISSFAFDEKQAVVDGNVFRFLSRYFGISTPIDSGKAKKEFREIAFGLMDKHAPHEFNQAIMEFGSKQCKPGSPDCSNCPMNVSCFAFENNRVNDFPVKNKKLKVKHRYFHYLIIKSGKSIFIQKRTEKDIWAELYDFPLLESDKKQSEKKFLSSDEWKQWSKQHPVVIDKISSEKKHLLSHQTIHARFIHLRPKNEKTFKPQKGWILVNKNGFRKYAIPRLTDRYLAAEPAF